MKICIGTITRNRPEMLRALLHSYSGMVVPEGVDLCFIVVENNAEITVGPVVESVGPLLAPKQIIVETETRLGIPFARNRVLDIALQQEADFLTFVDDDERVDTDWLKNLFETSLKGGFDLVGGPVLIDQMPQGTTWFEAVVWRGLQARNEHAARKARSRFARKGENSINVSTANWLGRLDFFRAKGLRFDEGIGTGSGSDRRLYKQLVAIGGKAGWTYDAKVYDTVPRSRLTLVYQFRRGREHTAFLYADPAYSGRPSALEFAFKALGRLPRVVIAVVSIPFTGGKSMVMAARLLGDAVGFIDASRGIYSSHYKNVTGQ